MANKTIFLVDDNQHDVFLTKRALKKQNIINEVVTAADGVEAIEYLTGTGCHAGRDLSQMPVLVLLDLKMPKVDGLEVLKFMRANELTKLIPVVVFTSSREEADIVASYRFGCNAFVRKPVDFMEFADAIKQLGLFWMILNEPPH
jgi:two-component system response regulator